MRTGPHQTRSGHVSVSDPLLGPIQGLGMFCPGTLGPPLWAARTPCGGGLDPIPGVRLAQVEVRDQPWRSGLYIRGSRTNLGGPACISRGPVCISRGLAYISRGPTLSRGSPDSLLMLWSMPPSLDTWRLRTRPCGGVGRCCGPRIAA
jgi:hypothetical protein